MIRYNKTSYVNILLFIIFILSVFIDLFNGYIQQVNAKDTILPVIFKGAIIILLLKYVFLNKKSLFIFIGFLFLYSFLLLSWTLFGYIDSFSTNISSFSKLIYPFAIWIILNTNRKNIDSHRLLMLLMLYGFTIASSILVIDFLGLSISSYGEGYGYGVKGFFKAGNDISLAIILSTCISSYFLSINRGVNYVFINAVLLISLLRLGTTASFLGIGVNIIGLTFQSFFVSNKCSRSYNLYRLFIALIGIPLIIYSLSIIISLDNYTSTKFDIDHILSGGARDSLKDAFYNIYQNFSFTDYLFGIGPEEFGSRIGENLGLIGSRSLEVDHLELLGTYGLILGSILVSIPLVFFFKYFKDYMKRKSSFSYWATISIVLFISHGFFAGHAYTSIQAMTVVVGLYCLFPSKLDFK